tara:strand:- start:421 stop:591 length:171 start_codon:yes stop_codon:yes gene_type:complete
MSPSTVPHDSQLDIRLRQDVREVVSNPSSHSPTERMFASMAGKFLNEDDDDLIDLI